MASKECETEDSGSDYEFSVEDSDNENYINDLDSESDDDMCFDSEDDVPLLNRTDGWIPYTAEDLNFRKFNFSVPSPGF